MTDSSTTLHEDPSELSAEVKDRHRAIVSLMEELEATDWYDQRVQACRDPELRAVLAHNRDEEKEHAAMVLEWLRRNDPRFEDELREYLFQDGPIVGREAQATGQSRSKAASGHPGSLGIGSLRIVEEQA